MYKVGTGHFLAKMICIARIPQKYMYIMKRVTLVFKTYIYTISKLVGTLYTVH